MGKKTLKEAISNRDMEALREILATGVDLEAPIASDNATPLFYAVARDNVAAIELLIEHGANVNAVNDSNQTPLSKYCVGYPYRLSQLTLAKAKDLDLTSAQTLAARDAALGNAEENLGSRRVYNILNQRMLEHDGPWFKMDDQTIKHLKFDWDSMIEVSEVFNFKAARQTTVVRDFENSTTNVEHCYFADIPENGIQFVKEALEELKARDGGKDVDDRILSQGFRYMKRRR